MSVPKIPSMAGLMPGPARTQIALPTGNRHVPLLPLAASRMTLRAGP
jgi:hypothetical protein